MEWEKVEDKIFKFEKEGDCLEGTLIAKEEGKNFGNQVYKIQDKQGTNWTIFSTSVMESQMQTVEIGNLVKVLFVGEKENKKKGQNNIKLFEVFVKK